MTDQNIYYVYQYIREDGSPYYIGYGHGNRIHDLHTNVETPKNKNQRQLISINLFEHRALLIENILTNLYGLIIDGTGILENKIHGGNSSPRGMLGKKHSDETKLKISLGNSGKRRSEEHKANYSKPKTKEHAEKIRQAVLNIAENNPSRYAYLKPFSHKGRPWSQARRDAQNLKKEKL